MNDTQAETYYNTAYVHGTEAFARGEGYEDCGKHYNGGDPRNNPLAPLGVRGWQAGWYDAHCAARQDRWTDDASYRAYQSARA